MPRTTAAASLAVLVAALAACSTAPPQRTAQSEARGTAPTPLPKTGPRGGAYYKDDGPGDNPPPNLDATPDAVPRVEPFARNASNRPYNVFGKTYVPDTTDRPFRQRGIASWYGRKFHGQRTSSGELYDMYAMTAAHPTLPIPSYAKVTNVKNGRSVVVRVNDRGPFHSSRIMDLSYTAALKLGYVGQGSAEVEVERLTFEDIARLQASGTGLAGSAAPGSAGAAAAPTMVAAGGAAAPGGSGASPSSPSSVPAGAAGPATSNTSNTSGAPVTSAASAPAAATSAEASATDDPLGSLILAADRPDPPAAEGGVFLQVGAFASEGTALSLRDRVQRDATWLSQGLRVVNLDRLFKVHIGPFKDRAEASSVAERLRATLAFTPVIVTR